MVVGIFVGKIAGYFYAARNEILNRMGEGVCIAGFEKCYREIGV